MTRDPRINMALATGLLGLQGQDGVAGLAALALVMHTLKPWRPPEGKDLERARTTAARFKLSDDLAIFVPPEPGRFAARAKKDAYREVVIALKRLDELKGAEREQAITEVVALLGGGLR